MASHRIDRTIEDVRREIMAILRTVKDPRVSDCFISVVRVEVTNDLSYCTIYVSTIEGLERTKEAVKGLQSAAGYIRRELGNAIKLRHTPQMIFKATNSIEYSASIAEKLNHLVVHEDENGEEE